MKKFIIAICGISIATSCFAGSNHTQQTPNKSGYSWFTNNDEPNNEITTFYPDVQNEFGTTGHSTWTDEGAIIIYAAREIYAHGAKFCPVNIQASNQNGVTQVWIDYYWRNDEKWTNCADVCIDGYHGTECSKTGHGSIGSATPDFSPYKLPDWESIRETGDTYRQTTNMHVIMYKNGEGTYQDNPENLKTKHNILGIVGTTTNGIFVAPILVIGERNRTGGGIKSWINSARASETTLLCFDGYVTNYNKTECVEYNPPAPTPDDNGDTDYCPDGYGFISDSNHHCTECQGPLNGVLSNGVCKKCNNGTMFNPNATSEPYCTGYKTYSKPDMRKCWTITNSTQYKSCVEQ